MLRSLSGIARRPSCPKFSNVPPHEEVEWRSVTELSLEIVVLVEAVHQLQDKGLLGMQILQAWMERNIQPLGWRVHPMYDYKGLKDPSLFLDQEISQSDLKVCMHLVTGIPLEDIFLVVVVEPYHRGNPSHELCF